MGYHVPRGGDRLVTVPTREAPLSHTPDLRALLKAARRKGGVLVAVEMPLIGIRVTLGELTPLHFTIIDALPGAVPLWEGIELRVNERLGHQRFMPIFECVRCAGAKCVHCGMSGEVRGF
jgi:hypothetical protein